MKSSADVTGNVSERAQGKMGFPEASGAWL